MAQGYTKFPTSGTLSGLDLVTQLNNAMLTVTTLQGGVTDPATVANNTVQSGVFWNDTNSNLLKIRNTSNTGWIPLIKTNNNYLINVTSDVQTQLNAKQNTLVSNTNIKTINGTSILGSGDLTIGTPITPRDADDDSSAYPDGLSTMAIGSSQTGWPMTTCSVITNILERGAGQRISQIVIEKTGEGMWYRTRDINDTAWEDFVQIVDSKNDATIDGTKTFSSSPVVPFETLGQYSTKAVNSTKLWNEVFYMFGAGNSKTVPLYACRAWVSFYGFGTLNIFESGNVSSITDNGVGKYTVNLTAALPDAFGAAIASGAGKSTFTDSYVGDFNNYCNAAVSTASTAIVAVVDDNNAFDDAAVVNVAIFR